MSAADEEFLQRLQAAFAVEAEEHIQAMSDGLLKLEKADSGEQQALIEVVYREAHSLKGAARAVNLSAIEMLCQAMESVFSSWKKGELQPSPTQLDVLLRALDGIEQCLSPSESPTRGELDAMVTQLDQLRQGRGGASENRAATNGTPARSTSTPSTSRSSTSDSDGAIRGRQQTPERARSDREVGPPSRNGADRNGADRNGGIEARHQPVSESTSPQPAVSPTPPTLSRQATLARPAERPALPETVRISTTKLNALFLEAEEMLVAKLTAGQRAAELQDVGAMLANWRKEWSKIAPELRALRQQLERRESGEAAAPGEAADDAAASSANGVEPGEAAEGLLSTVWLEFLDENQERLKEVESRVLALSRAARHDAHTVGGLVDNLLEDAKKLLLLPFSTLLQSFPKLVRDISRDQHKDVALHIEGGEVEIDKRILEEMKDPLVHLLRNSVDHGIEKPEDRERAGKPNPATVTLTVAQTHGKVEIRLSDDGGGIHLDRVKAAAVEHGVLTEAEAEALRDDEALALIFASEVSTSPSVTEISGRGIGMAIVREKVENLGGSIEVESEVGRGTTFRILLPLTLATFKGLRVHAGGQVFVIPTANVERVARVRPHDIKTVENRETVTIDEEPVAFVRMEELLELPYLKPDEKTAWIRVVVLGGGDKRIACGVDEIGGEQEYFVKSLGKLLARVRNVAAATVLGSGRAVPILNVADLLLTANSMHGSGRNYGNGNGRGNTANGNAENGNAETSRPAPESSSSVGADEPARQAVLVAEDSITSRMLLKNILESAGYEVQTTVDGADAWTALHAGRYDLVVSDVDMPRLDGFSLTAKIRADKQFAEIPVVLVTSRETREDRERGIDVGANAYVIKSSFDQSNLLQIVQRLI